MYDTTKHKWSPEDYVCYESYFFTGDDYNRLRIFLEEMSDQTIEKNHEKIVVKILFLAIFQAFLNHLDYELNTFVIHNNFEFKFNEIINEFYLNIKPFLDE